MRPKLNLLILSFMALATGIVFGCSSGSMTSSESDADPVAANTVTGTPPQNSEGLALYGSKCSGCHGNIDVTNIVTPTSFSDIRGAISSNVGGMRMFAALSDADLQAIADALNTPGAPAPAPAPTQTGVTSPATLDGAAIYASRCAACHGILASSNKIGTNAGRVQNAIAGNIGGMGSLSTLTALEIQAVVAAMNPPGSTPAPLATSTPSTSPNQDGASLYSANCAGCHGALGSSAKVGTTLARLQSATNNNIGGMGFLSQLTVTQQQAIVTVLTSTTPSPTPAPSPTPVTDGATLYGANCAGCHGTLGASAKVGTTLARLQSATNNNIGGMGFLSQLTVTQQQAIVTVLTSTTPPSPTPAPSPTPVTDGATLYGANCAGCHGALASSGKAGATTSRIQSAITGNIGNMGYLSMLSATQVTAIAAVLTTAAPPSPTDGPGLYAANCASCHRSLAKSEVRGDSANDISEAIRKNKGGMGILSSLTSGMITAIANALKK